MEDVNITIAGPEHIDDLRELWLALHHHHQQVSSLQPLVTDDELSWERRSQLYRKELADGGGFLAIAARSCQPVGYATVVLREGPDDTWPVGERYAELYSLSVLPDERGRGIGGLIFEAVE
jgi:GNAT superfamily N-acetyltransferase